MTNLFTQSQVTALIKKVGGTTEEAKILGAISMVEAAYVTGGKSYADADLVGDQELANAVWGFSYNLWQVRSLRAQRGTGGIRDELALIDPEFAAKSALAIKRSQGYSAWSTYNTGQYKAFLQSEFPPPPGTYMVVSGDSLSRIAQKLNAEEKAKNSGHTFTWQDLARVNGLKSPYTIYIGYPIFLPWFEYKVVEGDTLTSIVDKYGSGVTLQRVAEFNGITNPNLINVGQTIRIPRATL